MIAVNLSSSIKKHKKAVLIGAAALAALMLLSKKRGAVPAIGSAAQGTLSTLPGIKAAIGLGSLG